MTDRTSAQTTHNSVTAERKHTPTPWEISALRPYEVKDGCLIIDHDQPHNRWTIKGVWRDEQNRRCTKYIAEVFSPGDAELIVKAVNEREALLNTCAELKKALQVAAEHLKEARDQMAALLFDPKAKTPEWPVLTEEDHRCLTAAYYNIRDGLDETQAALTAAQSSEGEGR